MSVYTVHQPPLRATDAAPDPERFTFVRDGFSIWAFLLAALWMLWHRMWLVLAIYVVVTAGLEAVLRYAGVSGPILSLVALLISLLVGMEAGTLRRFTLARRGWKNVGIVSAHDLEDAERRFFVGWADASPGEGAEPPTSQNSPPPSSVPLPRMSPPPDVIGLFPEPGAGR